MTLRGRSTEEAVPVSLIQNKVTDMKLWKQNVLLFVPNRHKNIFFWISHSVTCDVNFLARLQTQVRTLRACVPRNVMLFQARSHLVHRRRGANRLSCIDCSDGLLSPKLWPVIINWTRPNMGSVSSNRLAGVALRPSEIQPPLSLVFWCEVECFVREDPVFADPVWLFYSCWENLPKLPKISQKLWRKERKTILEMFKCNEKRPLPTNLWGNRKHIYLVLHGSLHG